MAFYVYVLKCSDDSYYTGHTDNLELRLSQHQSGSFKGYTTTRLPVRLVYQKDFVTREEALSVERQIKGWSRAKKEAMMREDWAMVSNLAKNRQT
jgi:putative endonuclease